MSATRRASTHLSAAHDLLREIGDRLAPVAAVVAVGVAAENTPEVAIMVTPGAACVRRADEKIVAIV